MGGVDLHDYRCKKVASSMRSKKWTWSVFVRLIQSALANATGIWNISRDNRTKEMKTKEMCMKVSEHYLKQSKIDKYEIHKYDSRYRQTCSSQKCALRTTRFCLNCSKYYCINCFSNLHLKSSK